MSFLTDPAALARLFVTAFFAVVFLQSAADKLLDRSGNIAYFSDHFKNSPFPPEAIPLLFWILTSIEATAGVLCGLGILVGSFRHEGMGVASTGLAFASLALLCLLVGQRLAKDYAGAAVVAAYFAVALIGILTF
jgi:putative oxidoreductase